MDSLSLNHEYFGLLNYLHRELRFIFTDIQKFWESSIHRFLWVKSWRTKYVFNRTKSCLDSCFQLFFYIFARFLLYSWFFDSVDSLSSSHKRFRNIRIIFIEHLVYTSSNSRTPIQTLHILKVKPHKFLAVKPYILISQVLAC